MDTTRYSMGMSLVFSVFLIMAWLVSPAIGGHHESASGVLDGKTFAVETGDKGKGADDKDTLIFRNGKFRSVGCEKYGFGDGSYTTTAQGDTITFVAEIKSEKKGRISWEGTVRGDKIDADYVWTDKSHWYKSNPKPVEKWAKGELKMSE